ncbi:MAG: UvrD-helicase domain-containing protein [Bacteroidota bacterium]|nr:UvrD-helicase domain-containing protein [Bacteroidota bacterium]MDP4233412.1 UvrD-helicase domain-containing protein [Bacteroidota bacterium]MDP4242278.1 UvrD-helicase domain-containing protein [Bacteroidota bacterium]MDP4287034.1 UvrD-helicase domain-containing protein [Bacteroidota bacterium]
MLQLTPTQQKALSTERHLAITANAGSGKTRVLVERYVNLFETAPDLQAQNVVAITFTENAGAELRKKILGEVNERIAALPRVSDRRSRLTRLRDTLPSAFIGTIHSFASRMLRSYPVEANVDASFSIIEGADERLLREEVIERTFYSLLDEAYEQPEEPPVLHLFRALGRKEVSQLVRTLLANPARTNALRLKLLVLTDDTILSSWREKAETLLQYPQSARDLISDLYANVKTGKLGKEVVPYFEAYLKAREPFAVVFAFAALAKKMMTNAGTIHSQRIDLKNVSPDLVAEREEFVAYIQRHKSLLESIPASEEDWLREHRAYISLMRSATTLADQVAIEYTADKSAYGLLDFNDLIQRFHRLLEEPRIREELSRQFRFIMIDEFQDTDASQFELARLLTENFSAHTNLMIVGDPKQSIYGFRNADVAVFHETESKISGQVLSGDALAESITLSLSPEEERGRIQLGESFRMASRPLATINKLFHTLMQPATMPFAARHEVAYSELIFGRVVETAGGVEWICPVRPSKSSLGEGVEGEDSISEDAAESELIARKIAVIVGNTRYQIEENGNLREARYGDVAILLRSRTNLPLIERSLHALGIPFVVSKGAGFFLQQEILDATSYLSFLISPNNDIALIAILRSPFFALSDVDLFQIALHSAKHQEGVALSFWDKLRRYCSQAPKPYLLHALELLEANLAIAGRTGAAFLLEKIYSETGMFATLAAGADGRQKIANLEKFLGMARASDAGGFSSLFDFVERIQYLIDEDEKESQADSAGVTDAVRIMTVHAAKGLEFPIVVIPFLQKRFQFDSRGMLDPEIGLHIRFSDAERQPLIAEIIREEFHARTIAEEKRIFYVAMTRARDHLILSSTLPMNSPKDSWLAWAGAALPAVFDESCSTIPLEERVTRYDSNRRERSETFIKFAIPLLRTESDIPLARRDTTVEAPDELGPFHLSPITIERSTSRYSATQFLRFRECPTKYHLSYALGLPEEPRLAYDLEADLLSETVRGSLLGQIVHRVLASIDSLVTGRTVNAAKVDRELSTVFFSLGVLDTREQSKLRHEALRHIQNVIDSPLALKVIAASDVRTEYSLQTQVPSGNTFYGIIDRLYRDADGIWTILDYKTEHSHNKERDRANRERHKFQLRFYAYLVHLMYPEESCIKSILFYTDRGEALEFSFTPEDFIGLEVECDAMIERIRQNEMVTDLIDLDRNLKHCPDCKFLSGEACIVLNASESERKTGQIAIFT